MVKKLQQNRFLESFNIRKSMTTVATIGLIAATFSFAPTSTYANAGQNDAEAALHDGSKARINLSARLRSLTEDVAATTCRIMSDATLADDAEHLKVVKGTFDAILDGLENGDDRFGIPNAETKSTLRRQIQDVRNSWSPIRMSADRLLDGAATDADREILATAHRDLLEMTKALASEISGTYTNPLELMQSDAVTLDFLGRQRSLATRFARATCGIYAGNPEIGTEAELQEAIGFYEQTYQALIQGMPAAGVSAPPSEAVKSVLEESLQSWQDEKSVLADGGFNSEIAVTSSATFAANSVRETNNAITLYILSSPGQSDTFASVLKSYAEDQLLSWLEDPIVIESILDQNGKHKDLTQDAVVSLDNEWRAEAKGAEGDMIETALANSLSRWLYGRASDTAGIVTEVFVMDNLGLNVGQSAQTSDYWQGDEAKWIKTYGQESDDLHISELEYDESSRSYQTQASKIIRDPATGERIGAVTFGINVVNLM